MRRPDPFVFLTVMFLSAVTIGICFMVVDCSAGSKLIYECRVAGRNYVPPWTELRSSTDADGNVQFTTIHHDAEYHLFCDSFDSDDSFDVSTTAQLYHTITNDQGVIVAVRKGRWTGAKYLPRIEQ